MPFELIEKPVSSGRAGMPASVSLVSIRGGRPTCWVGLSADLTAKCKIDASTRFDVLIGTGAQAGLLHLRKNPKGAFQGRSLKHGSLTIRLGHIEKFGLEPEPKEYCLADLVDENTIEIGLPAWARESEG